MKLEYYSEKKLRKEIKSIFAEHLDPHKYRVFFFGSRVRGDSHKRSDIDIGIEGPKEIPPRIFFEIKEGLENLPILYRIQCIDFKTVSKEFKKEALKYQEYV